MDPLGEHNKVVSEHNGVLCIAEGATDPAPQADGSTVRLYEVTPGTLNGVLASAEAALAARPDRDTCGLTVNKLAAFMLSIGFREVQAEGSVGPARSRSPMTLSRRDVGKDARPRNPDGTFSETKTAFEERWDGYEDNAEMYLYSDDQRLAGPPRAFFHPGVGLWQLDDAGGTNSWVLLNHGERANTGTGPDGTGNDDSGGGVVAKLFGGAYCGGSTSDQGENVRIAQASQWAACGHASYQQYRMDLRAWNQLSEEDKTNTPRPEFTNNCFERTYPAIYIDDSRDLNVTIAQDLDRYSASGGVIDHSCRWEVGSADGVSVPPFPCHFYDTEHPEGWIDASSPATTERPDTDGSLGSSPLAAAFLAFTHDAKRFAVFPDKILDASSRTDDAIDSTRYKAVPQAANARRQADTWSTASYGGAVLQVQICDDSDWVTAANSGSCRWVSVSDGRFAQLIWADSDDD